MEWNKLGNIFCPSDYPDWNYSFGAVPYVGEVDNSLVKIYFTGRDSFNRSGIHWGVFDFEDNFKLIELSQSSELELGNPGTFDEDGVMGCQIYRENGRIFLYYQGWNVAKSTPFRNAIGVACYNNNSKKFEKLFKGPILDRSIHDNCFVATPYVVSLGDNKYIMYYLSCDSWDKQGHGLLHRYNIKIAESTDCISWSRSGKIAIDYASEDEFAFSVPRVITEEGIYKMMFSFRSKINNGMYRLGYAESRNAFDWERMDDKVGISTSTEGWDSEMICYPYVFDMKKKRYLLYNGNEYGKTGFGIAELANG